jgi:flavin-dependent dehydrogenase
MECTAHFGAEQKLNVDVVVFGAGPAGCALAIVLARFGRQVALVGSDRSVQVVLGETLPPGANQVLNLLDLDSCLEGGGHLPCNGYESAWGSADVTTRDFIFNRWGTGWQVDRGLFDQTLREQSERAGVQVFCPAKPMSVSEMPEGFKIELNLGGQRKQLQSTFAADCTGRASSTARRFGVCRKLRDRQVAIALLFVRNPGSEEESDFLSSFVESTAEGWWYTARIPGHKRVVIYFTDLDLPQCRRARRMPGFLELLSETRHVALRCAKYSPLEETPRARDASTSRLEHFAGDRWVAAGDAAFSLDPLSSGGMMRALQGGVGAGMAIEGHLRGDHTEISRYDAVMNRAFTEHEVVRRMFYSREERWTQSDFWKRRTHGSETNSNS